MKSTYVDVSIVPLGTRVRFPCGCRSRVINRHQLLGTEVAMDYTRVDCREGLHRLNDFYTVNAYPVRQLDDFLELLAESFGDPQAELSPDPECCAPLVLEIDPSTGALK